MLGTVRFYIDFLPPINEKVIRHYLVTFFFLFVDCTNLQVYVNPWSDFSVLVLFITL
jgi:hypothetical protein